MTEINKFHKILQRQIRKYIDDPELLKGKLAAFLAEVSATYQGLEGDISLKEHSYELSEKDLLEVNQQLKVREKALREGERRLILALQAGGVGTWTWTVKTDALMLDTFALPLFGRERKGFVGSLTDLIGFFPLEERPLIENEIRGCVDSKGSFLSQHAVVWPDGAQHILEVRGRAFSDSESKSIQIAGTFVDITERKRAEEQMLEQKQDLEKVNAELDAFVYTASHDLRAPLRGISSFATFLEEDYLDKLDDEGKDYISEIRQGADRMSVLIEDLLALSRISRIKNPFEDVSIRNVLHSIEERLKHDIKEYNVELVIPDDLPQIRCDRIKITEVLVNLVNNAIKFSAKNENERPRVQIGYEDIGSYHQFWVKDNGIGIDPKYHDQIFGMFKRLHKISDYDGTGAGLSIVQKIVEQHCGRIWIDSAEGQGAKFIFTIDKRLGEKKKLGEILIEDGIISKEQLNQTLQKQAGLKVDLPPSNKPTADEYEI